MIRKISVLLIVMMLATMMPQAAYAAGTLKYGSSGSNVEEVQQRLHQLDYYFGSINGKFNTQTENAVKLFQENNGLPVTGQVNAATRNKLMSSSALARNEKKPASSGSSSSGSSSGTSTSSSSGGTLKYGSSGSNVEEVQKRLHQLDYYFGSINGKFNTQTENAVKLFQENNGLPVTGQVNAATRNKLMSSTALGRDEKKPASSGSSSSGSSSSGSSSSGSASSSSSSSASSSSGGTLKYGMTNSAVKGMQQRLSALGYFSGTADGKYDGETRDAVEMFQRANDLSVTGTADSRTRRAMDSSNAVSKSEFYATCPVGKGDSGYAVKLVQERLKALGYYFGATDGKYDTETANAVKKFQDVNGLAVTGNCDYATRKKMNSTSAVKKPSSAVSAKPDTPSSTLPETKPESSGSSSAARAETVIAAAQAQMGKPYVLGTSGLNSFDCSGLTRYSFGLVGIDLAHSAYTQGYQNMTRLNMSQLRRGDLVVFNTNTKDGDLADHVGIYLGNGTFIHASSSKGRVIISTMSDYSKYFSWGLRLL